MSEAKLETLKLSVPSIDYANIEDKTEDPILGDDLRLKAAAALWETNREALRDVLQVMLCKKARYMVQKADASEFLPIRHELAAIEEVFNQFQEYATEHQRSEAAKKAKEADEAKTAKK